MSGGGWLKEAFWRLGDVVDNPRLVELCVNPDGTVWIEMLGDHSMRAEGRTLDLKDVRDLAHKICSVGESTLGVRSPIVSGSVVYKGRPIRYQVIGSPAVSTGHSISLRFFSSLPLDEIKLGYLYGTAFSMETQRREKRDMLERLASSADLETALRFCIEQKMNILISGGTSSGKTVAARKMLSYVDPSERIITIEEAAELLPTQPNAVTLMADREDKSRSTDVLLTSSLRMRPDRLIVGEVRGAEAMTFLEAINTGHGGSMTTIHAETPQLAVARLAIAALKTNVPMTYRDMISYIQGSIDVILQTGRADGKRGITEFYLPGGLEPVATEAA